MTTVSVRVTARDGGTFEAWLARPASGRGPGMVVLGEVYNANPWARSVAERYAAEGYVTLVPDLFWRLAPGTYLDYTPEGRDRGRELSSAMDKAAYAEDVRACADWLRARDDCTGRVGSVGFCLGGTLVWLAMARQAVDAGVAYYAARIEPHLGAAASIDGPLMMHFGSRDEHAPRELYDRIAALLAGKPDASNFWYEGAEHGFSRHGYPPHHPEAAALAWQRSLDFFARHLGRAAA